MSEKIIHIEAFDVAVPLPRPLHLGSIYIVDREYTLVRIRDENGLCGTAVGLTRNAPVAATVLRSIAPHITGCPFEDYDLLYEKVVSANRPLGTNGIFWRALSLLDCAMNDLLAQRAGLPLYAFLGGECKMIPCVLVGGYPSPIETPASLQDQAKKMASLNAAVVKIGSCGNFSKDGQRLQVIREAIPGGPPLAIDLYWQCKSHKELLPEAAAWARFEMAWIEDPFAFDDYKSAAALSGALSYPLAIGDEQAGEMHLERLMDEAKIGILRLDATVCGGIKAFLRIASAARDRNIPVATHLFHHLHLQLACAAPAVKWVEQFLPGTGLDSLDRLWRSDLALEKGSLMPASEKGSVWNWDEEQINFFRKKV